MGVLLQSRALWTHALPLMSLVGACSVPGALQIAALSSIRMICGMETRLPPPCGLLCSPVSTLTQQPEAVGSCLPALPSLSAAWAHSQQGWQALMSPTHG